MVTIVQGTMTYRHPSHHDLLQALSDLLEGQADRISEELLARAAVDFCTIFLRRSAWSRSWNFDAVGLRLDDVAFDVLGEILAEGESGPCAELRRGMLNTIASHPPGEVSPLGAFHAVLITTMNQKIGRCFASCDPVRGKILARLRKHVARSETLVSIHGANGRWYARTQEGAALQRPGLPYEDLLQLASGIPVTERMEYALLEGLLNALEDFPQFRQAVAEADLVQATVELLGSSLSAVYQDSDSEELNEQRRHLIVVIDSAIDEMRPWLEKKFILPGKLTKAESEAILRAGRIYLEDAMDGETDSIYSYLALTMPGLTRAEYRRDYHNRVGYILNHLFNTVGERVLYLQRKGKSEVEAAS